MDMNMIILPRSLFWYEKSFIPRSMPGGAHFAGLAVRRDPGHSRINFQFPLAWRGSIRVLFCADPRGCSRPPKSNK